MEIARTDNHFKEFRCKGQERNELVARNTKKELELLKIKINGMSRK